MYFELYAWFPIMEHNIQIYAQDEDVVDVLLPGPGEHGQHLVAVPVLGQGDDLHLCLLVSLAAHILDHLALLHGRHGITE